MQGRRERQLYVGRQGAEEGKKEGQAGGEGMARKINK